jgi:hypothetical protein
LAAIYRPLREDYQHERTVVKSVMPDAIPAHIPLPGVRHDHAALEEQLFDVAQAQLEAEIPTHCATDDAGRKTVAVIKRFRFLHRCILRDRPNNLKMPNSPPQPLQIR